VFFAHLYRWKNIVQHIDKVGQFIDVAVSKWLNGSTKKIVIRF